MGVRAEWHLVTVETWIMLDELKVSPIHQHKGQNGYSLKPFTMNVLWA